MNPVDFKPHFMNHTLASTPFTNPEMGSKIIADYFTEDVPMPRFTRSLKFLLGGMPCLVIDPKSDKFFFDISPEREEEMLRFYDRYQAQDFDYWAINPQECNDLFYMLDELKTRTNEELKLITCAGPGPLNFGYMITDRDGKPCLFDVTLRDIMIKHVSMKLAWMERQIRKTMPGVHTAVEVGEPTLSIFTSAIGTGSRKDIQKWLQEIFANVQGFKGVHCCANADWTILFETGIDYFHFDAYMFGDKLALFSDSVDAFLSRGGMIGWGIVPSSDENMAVEGLDSLENRLEDILISMAEAGVDKQLLNERSIISTCCTTANMSPEMATKAYLTTRQLSERMRQKHPL